MPSKSKEEEVNKNNLDDAFQGLLEDMKPLVLKLLKKEGMRSVQRFKYVL